jgi:hypothetical protein
VFQAVADPGSIRIAVQVLVIAAFLEGACFRFAFEKSDMGE